MVSRERQKILGSFGLLTVALVMAMAAALFSACAKPPQELRISSLLWPGYEPLVLAETLNYFDEAPIRVLDYLSNTDAMAAFKNHRLEAGAFTLDETLQLLADGVDVQVVLIMDTSHGGDVIVANPDIASVKALKGHAVAVESSAVGAYVLQRALDLNGLTLDDIRVKTTHAMEQKQAFEHGQVAAAVSFDPYRTQLLQTGKHTIFDSTQIADEILDVLVVRTDVIEQSPELVRTLVAGWFKALDYQRRYPENAAGYALPRYKVSLETYLDSLSGLRFTSLAKNQRLLAPSDSPLHALEPKLKKALIKLGLVDAALQETALLKGHLNHAFLPTP
ncbi:MAG: ABC transporter substrate-binding protein [Hydrogenovibrio sp.]|uniref:ABC transporter substrate-binding protein n=1 Tax=Hydrogenovibrio sp. TaxID=2065821 RepID=UPI0028701204|nr:ABC transporter substrate-binding protein [Hydrogenovibrio sp.]MDR9499642.1 ABC transporter substrate-binding protein [Hydrogenovibrio sp.]